MTLPQQNPPSAPPVADGQPPAGSDVVGVSIPGLGVEALSRQDVSAIKERGKALSDQLLSVARRRSDLLAELESAESPVVRTGIEQRLTVLDDRLVELEKAIAENGRLKASLPANMRSSTQEAASVANQPSLGPITPGIAFVLLAPVALAVARMFWRRGNRMPMVPISPEANARMEQLEQAIDTVAVEIERVSEGQRFLTKLLRDGDPIPDFTSGRAGDAVPVDVRGRDGSP